MEREYSLDVLKCVATIGIIFHHYQQLTGAWFVGGLNFWNGKFYWGYLVELFFILSGYFTWHYIPRIQKDSKALYFIGKKYIRFFPLLVITGCVCTILELYYFRSGENPFTRTIWDWVMGILGIRQWFGDLFTVNNPLWYISVLLLCYLVFFYKYMDCKEIKLLSTLLLCSNYNLGNHNEGA